MVIKNNFTLLWAIETLAICNDYTQSFYNLNVEMGSMVGCFNAETLAEIDAKVLELGLTDPDMLVTPH